MPDFKTEEKSNEIRRLLKTPTKFEKQAPSLTPKHAQTKFIQKNNRTSSALSDQN